jgi:hypothetical protein
MVLRRERRAGLGSSRGETTDGLKALSAAAVALAAGPQASLTRDAALGLAITLRGARSMAERSVTMATMDCCDGTGCSVAGRDAIPATVLARSRKPRPEAVDEKLARSDNSGPTVEPCVDTHRANM